MFSHDLHAYVRANMGPGAVRVGPFLATFDAHDDGLFRNHAVPDDGARPTAADVDALVAAFTDRHRTPRLEFLPGPCPGVEPALLAAGFVRERALPVLGCTPEDASAPPVDVPLRTARSRPELRAAAEAQNEAYGVSTTSEHDVDRLAAVVAGGGLVGVAWAGSGSSYAVAAGLCTPPHGGIAELAAVGVRTAHRRRGIAAALTAFLTRECRAAGIDQPFLTPAGQDEERIYRRVGYRDRAEMIHISRPG